jgi:hypothetical protein
MYGEGSESCGKWLATDHNGAMSYRMGEWILGWVSAAGYYNVQGALRISDPYALTGWVDKYCREHPLDNLAIAAARLVDELSKPK